MGLWTTLTGRSRPRPALLDALFHVPSAAVTLETTMGLTPTGEGSVCYRPAAGSGFATTERDALELLADVGPEVMSDGFGFRWLQVRRAPTELEALCTDLHAVNTTLESAGFGPALLCSLVVFTEPAGRRVGLVYLYKQGTFYAFAPAGDPASQRRDNLLELQVRDALSAELPVEQDLGRWLALWGAPGVGPLE